MHQGRTPGPRTTLFCISYQVMLCPVLYLAFRVPRQNLPMQLNYNTATLRVHHISKPPRFETFQSASPLQGTKAHIKPTTPTMILLSSMSCHLSYPIAITSIAVTLVLLLVSHSYYSAYPTQRPVRSNQRDFRSLMVITATIRQDWTSELAMLTHGYVNDVCKVARCACQIIWSVSMMQ